MDHLDAVRISAIEKYLLNELPPGQRDEFEEHYFGCMECAEDLRATAAFLELAKSELKARPLPKTAAVRKPGRFFFWTPAFLAPALAASLLVIAYQNIVPGRGSADVASLRSAELLPVVSLVGSNSRGGDAKAIVAPAGRAFSVALDIPSEDRYAGYTCELLPPSGASLWHVDISPQQAKDTVSIRVPAIDDPGKTYTLVVWGDSSGDSASSRTEVARYHFVLQKRS